MPRANSAGPKPWPVTEIRMMNVDGSNDRLLRDDIDTPFLSMQWAPNSRSVLIDAAYEMCRAHPDDFIVCTSRSEVHAARAAAKIAIVLTVEGQSLFGENLAHLRNWHRLGVRIANVTHGGGGRPGARCAAAGPAHQRA